MGFKRRLFWCAALITSVQFAFAADAVTNWSHLFDEGDGTHVLFGTELASPPVFSRHAEKPLLLASNTKLFIASAALQKLGPEFQFETRAEWNAVNAGDPSTITQLKLIGSGDPSWGMSEFGEALEGRITTITEALVKAGVRKIKGEITLEASDSRWQKLRYPPGWQLEDHTECYGALAQAFNLNLNCAVYVVTASNQGHWAEQGIPVPVKLEIIPGSTTNLQVSGVDAPELPDAEFVIRGKWRTGSASQQFALPIHRSTEWVRNLFIISLKAHGIKLIAHAPAAFDRETHELKFYSPPLKTLVKAFMKNSIDTMGDDFFKKLGELDAASRESDLLSAGQDFFSNYLNEQGSWASEISLMDGSGVSHSNHSTARALLNFLESLKTSPIFPDLWNSLPIAGVDGTLIYRMRGTAAAGVLRAKTGTLGGTYNLSGYIPDGHDFVPFVMLTQTSWVYQNAATMAEDRVGAELSKEYHRPSRDLSPEFPFPYVGSHAGLDRALPDLSTEKIRY